MSKKFDKKLTEIEDWLDDFTDALEDEGYSVVFQALKTQGNSAQEWYSFGGDPIGIMNALAELMMQVKDYIGYDSAAEFSNVLVKMMSIKDNVQSGRTAPELVQSETNKICEDIMTHYLNDWRTGLELDDELKEVTE
jgi:hypothetical protein